MDVEAYLERIGHRGPVPATLATLESLHLAHATTIPFENLDVILGVPVDLDVAHLEAKLVGSRRGGYCFEHNLLFAAVLEQLGFGVTRLAARVHVPDAPPRPRTHMLLAVEVDGDSWIADVGFGGEGLLGPLPLREDGPVRQFAWSFRLLRRPPVWVLQSLGPGGWRDLYTFTEEAHLPIDYEVANYYTSTHPRSPFTRHVLAQLSGPEVRWRLVDHQLSEERPDGVVTTSVAAGELADVLRTRFGLELAGVDVRVPEPAASGGDSDPFAAPRTAGSPSVG